MIKKYTYRLNNRPIEVEAIQFDGTAPKIEAIVKLTGIKDIKQFGDKLLRMYPPGKSLLVRAGDYVLRDPDDNITVMNQHLFEDRFFQAM